MEKVYVKQINKNNLIFFWTLVSLIAISTVLYVYFVNIMIFNTANRKVAEEKIIETKSEISELEFTFLEKTKTVTKELAYSIGFKDVEDVVFVENTGENLSFNTR